MLNEYTEQTKYNIHLLVTDKCDRDCPFCCNKQYDLDTIPVVSDEEMEVAKRIFLTGGEPFSYTNPCEIARSIKEKYNVEVYVYTNAEPLEKYLLTNDLHDIDGLTISVKSKGDERSFERVKRDIDSLKNRVYVFPGYHIEEEHIKRVWQEKFTPAPDSIFRKALIV